MPSWHQCRKNIAGVMHVHLNKRYWSLLIVNWKAQGLLTFSLLAFFSKSVLEDSNLLWQPILFIMTRKDQAFVNMHSEQCALCARGIPWMKISLQNQLLDTVSIIPHLDLFYWNLKMQEEILPFTVCMFIQFLHHTVCWVVLWEAWNVNGNKMHAHKFRQPYFNYRKLLNFL